MSASSETADRWGSQTITVNPGGIAYSNPILLSGSLGWSATTKAHAGASLPGNFYAVYTDYGNDSDYPQDQPKPTANYWHPWQAGFSTPYEDNRYSDMSFAKWVMFVYDDTGHTGSGAFDMGTTVRCTAR